MADSKISALAAVTDVLSTDEYVLARAGATKKITGANLKAGIAGMVLIEDQLLVGADADFDFTAIPATYKHLCLVVYARGDAAGASTILIARFNGDSGANYDDEYKDVDGTTNSAPVGQVAQTFLQCGEIPGWTAGASRAGLYEILIPAYAGTTLFKMLRSHGGWSDGTAVANQSIRHATGTWRSTAAINRVQLLPGSGNFVAGSRATLYGLN